MARERLADSREKAARLAPGAPLNLLGTIRPLPETYVPWAGPSIRVIEHQAHAPGHSALLIDSRGVLVAGDMLSDVEIPLLDLDSTDPHSDYLRALELLGDTTSGAAVVVPGHGAVARGHQIRDRIEADRAYVQALRDGREPDNPRVGPLASSGRDWLPGEHQRQVRHALTRQR